MLNSVKPKKRLKGRLASYEFYHTVGDVEKNQNKSFMFLEPFFAPQQPQENKTDHQQGRKVEPQNDVVDL